MIAQAVQKPLLAILIVLLIFNLTQRRHLEHGESKRFASLAFAALALLHYVATIVIIRFSLPDILLVIPILIAAFAIIQFRNKLFLFRFHCAACDAPIPIIATLYHDDNLCLDCRNKEEAVNEGAPHTGHPKNVSEINWDTWKADQDAALCLILHNHELLLICKKTGLGAGKTNMPGGRIEPGETAAEAAVRECQEEVGITPHAPEKRADLSFQFTDGLALHVSAFIAYSHSGHATESDEADPFWCDIDAIPFSDMWEDDALWIPRALAGERLKGVFIFDGDTMLSKDIQTVDGFQ